MLLHPEHTRTTFRKLARQMSKLAGKPVPESVHKFRTSSRRVEVLVSDLGATRSGNDKKLLKLLGRLRKKAGRVRDLDVQSAALRSLRIPQEPGRKSQLMRTLAEERARREKKLAKSLDKQTIAEVRKRLKRTVSFPAVSAAVFPGPRLVSVARLPVISPVIVGREEELKQLDDAWTNPNIRVV